MTTSVPSDINTIGTGTTNGTGGSNRSKNGGAIETSKSVTYGRLLFVVGLAGVAAVLGFFAFRLSQEAEQELAKTRFDSITERALSMAQLVLEEKKLTTDSLAHVAAAANPSAAEWPNVYIEGFEEISTSIRLVTEGQEIAFCPIVQPGGEEQASFEEFAYDFYESIRQFDNDPGVYSFGKGIFSFGNESAPDNRYHDTSGWTYYGSPNNVLVPAFQLDQGYHPSLLLNIHFEQTRGDMIDAIMTCSEERAAAGDYRECGSVTDMMHSQSQHADPGPAALLFVPTYPKFDDTTLTGFMVAKMIWHEVLQNGFSPDVTGLDAVLRTDNFVHTYSIEEGEVIYKGDEDLHEPNALFSASAHINPQYFSNFTVNYTLEIYSTDEYIQSYSTDNPKLACIVAVASILFTSLLFFLYDTCVRKDFESKKNLFEAKRQFVRFVSHEVRTPLNTVCMGLTLMQDDFATCLGMRNNNKGGARTRNQHKDGDSTVDTSASTTNSSSNNTMDQEQIDEWLLLSTQIHQNAEAAVSVLNDLLNYDKIQKGQLNLELSVIPVLQVLERTASEFKIAAMEKKIKLDLDLTPLVQDKFDIESGRRISASRLPADIKDSKIVGDHIRLSQVLRNLISNGLKFSKENGNLTIRVSEQGMKKKKNAMEDVVLENGQQVNLKRRGNIIVEVVDDGVGMTPDQVKTVFNDGTQFNANKFQAGGGSGLGLNIAKGIANGHNGKLLCSSAGMGQGTTFTLSLPLYNSLDDSGTINSTAPTANLDETSKSTESFDPPPPAELRVLVVDDSNLNRKLCIRLLEKHGHTCDGAADGKEAVQMVKDSFRHGRDAYDCILLDYEMPNMNGPEACEKIRKLGSSAHIVGVTGNVMSEDVECFRAAGANWVLPKPFRIEALEQQWVEYGITGNRNQGHDSFQVDGPHLEFDLNRGSQHNP